MFTHVPLSIDQKEYIFLINPVLLSHSKPMYISMFAVDRQTHTRIVFSHLILYYSIGRADLLEFPRVLDLDESLP